MDFIISFFRDFLDGPLYIVVTVICVILICSCIGYLGEQYLKSQEEKKAFEATHAAIEQNSIDATSLVTQNVEQVKGVTSLEQSMVTPMVDVADTVQVTGQTNSSQ